MSRITKEKGQRPLLNHQVNNDVLQLIRWKVLAQTQSFNLLELYGAAKLHTICEHDMIWLILCAHLQLSLHFLCSVFLVSRTHTYQCTRDRWWEVKYAGKGSLDNSSCMLWTFTTKSNAVGLFHTKRVCATSCRVELTSGPLMTPSMGLLLSFNTFIVATVSITAARCTDKGLHL